MMSSPPQRVMDFTARDRFCHVPFLPKDVDQRIYDRYQMEVMLNHTTKPIVFVSPDFEGCVAAVEMCEAVAGGADAFRDRSLCHLLHQRHIRAGGQRRGPAKVHLPGRKRAASVVDSPQCRRRQLAGHHCRVHGLHERRHPAGCRALAQLVRKGRPWPCRVGTAAPTT
jgi:hypothetical protein